MSETSENWQAYESLLNQEIRDLHHHAILQKIVEDFGLVRGDRILEIGAGYGRYSFWLVQQGFRVTAVEPNHYMATRLREKSWRKEMEIIVSPIEELNINLTDISLICGFHVLHHLRSPSVTSLVRVIKTAQETASAFKGWFFLEPNGLNPLYLIQIALNFSTMRLKYERDTWFAGYKKQLEAGLGNVFLGNVGLFPPNSIPSNRSTVLSALATIPFRHHTPIHAYQLLGQKNLTNAN